MNAKGFIGFIIYLLLGIALVGGSIYLWNLKTKLDKVPLPPSIVPVQKSDPVKGWKDFKNDSYGISLKYPPTWIVISDTIISQAIPGQPLVYPNVHNTIQIIRRTEQLYQGYYNQDFFNLIYFLKTDKPFVRDFFNSNNARIFKLNSGQTATHERFVIIKTEGESESADSTVRAVILKGGSELIILVLSDYNDFGLDTLKKIVSYSSLFAEKSI